MNIFKIRPSRCRLSTGEIATWDAAYEEYIKPGSNYYYLGVGIQLNGAGTHCIGPEMHFYKKIKETDK